MTLVIITTDRPTTKISSTAAWASAAEGEEEGRAAVD